MMASSGDPLAAALAQLAEQGERLRGQDKAIADLHVKITALRGQVKQAVPDSGGGGGGSYDPAPAVAWWRLTGEARAQAIRRLEAWLRDVYLPGYGHLAKILPSCWREHTLALYALDWLSELWSVLYLRDERTAATLAGQAELQTRILPVIAAQLEREAAGCNHARSQNGRTYPVRQR